MPFADGAFSLPFAGQPYFVSEYGGIWWNEQEARDAERSERAGNNAAASWGYGERVRSEEGLYTRFRGAHPGAVRGSADVRLLLHPADRRVPGGRTAWSTSRANASWTWPGCARCRSGEPRTSRTDSHSEPGPWRSAGRARGPGRHHGAMVDHAHLWDARTAAEYDTPGEGMLDPAVLGPTVRRLSELAAGGRALELAIGTGRVAIPLREAGVEVSGIRTVRGDAGAAAGEGGGGGHPPSSSAT